MKKKIVIAVLVLAIVLITSGIFLAIKTPLDEKEEKKKLTPEETVKDYVKQLSDEFVNGTSQKRLTTLLQNDSILETDIMTGPDMFLRQKPSDDTIKKNQLTPYVKKGEELAKNLEKAIKDNFEYTIEGVLDKDDYYGVLVSYKTFYYYAYINDLKAIQNELLIKKGYDFENITPDQTKTIEVDSYKAKIKAAMLLNENLKNYKNQLEQKETYVNFNNKIIAGNSESYMSYLMNIEGYTYDVTGTLQNVDITNKFLQQFNLIDPLNL